MGFGHAVYARNSAAYLNLFISPLPTHFNYEFNPHEIFNALKQICVPFQSVDAVQNSHISIRLQQKIKTMKVAKLLTFIISSIIIPDSVLANKGELNKMYELQPEKYFQSLNAFLNSLIQHFSKDLQRSRVHPEKIKHHTSENRIFSTQYEEKPTKKLYRRSNGSSKASRYSGSQDIGNQSNSTISRFPQNFSSKNSRPSEPPWTKEIHPISNLTSNQTENANSSVFSGALIHKNLLESSVVSKFLIFFEVLTCFPFLIFT
ncbi:hypothetical protein BY996DRAFT_7799139 [Phakopsora pachyrhizi]|nr:hypothetical protein BY996DRAFT_8152421 [Phakopsora pachyrhizi]KAI8446637.1 hypothetical protein BY996DRAFT_7799139 [Phakopsora pachyrhizi]